MNVYTVKYAGAVYVPHAFQYQWKTGIKARLALAVNQILESRKLKQREGADILGVPQPKVSALENYRLDQFENEKLMAILTILSQDVEIMMRPRRGADEVGRTSVLAVE